MVITCCQMLINQRMSVYCDSTLKKIITSQSFINAIVIYVLNLLSRCLQGKVKDIELKGHTDSVDQLCWDPKHADIIATASGDKTVRLWDARSKLFVFFLCFTTRTVRLQLS